MPLGLEGWVGLRVQDKQSTQAALAGRQVALREIQQLQKRAFYDMKTSSLCTFSPKTSASGHRKHVNEGVGAQPGSYVARDMHIRACEFKT